MVGSLHTKKKTKERKSMPGLEIGPSGDKPARKREKDRERELSGDEESSEGGNEPSHSTSEGHGTSPRKIDSTTPRLRTKLGVARSIRSARDFITQSSSNASHSPSAPSVELPKPVQPPANSLLSPRDSLQSPRQKIRTKILHNFPEPLPYDSFMRMQLDLFDAMDLDENTRRTIYNALRRAPAMRKLRHKPLCRSGALDRIAHLQEECHALEDSQILHQAATRIQSAFRTHCAQRWRRQMDDDFVPLKIQNYYDICAKEKDFVMNLATLVSQYIVPLRNSTDKNLKKIGGELRDVFSNIESIMEVHQNLLKNLYALPRDSWPHLRGLGNVFTCISPTLAIYGTYVHNFKYALNTLDDCMQQNEPLREFLRRKARVLSLDLTMLLSLPLNQIASYEHYLKVILDCTPEESPEHNDLLQAISITMETANFIANALGKAENIATIRRLFKSIPPQPFRDALFQRLEENYSQLVLERPVEFQQNGSKKVQGGTLYVFNDVAFVLSSKVEIKEVYSLDSCSVDAAAEDGSAGFSLVIVDEDQPQYNRLRETSRINLTLEDNEQQTSVVQTIQGLVTHNQHNRTFGVPIEVLVERDAQEDGIPVVVKDLIAFIEREGSHSVGIFRVPGMATIIKKVKALYNQSVAGDYPDLTTIDQFKPEDAAGVLKMFCNEMPEPLVPFSLYHDLIDIFPIRDQNLVVVLQDMKTKMDRIPYAKLTVLKYIIGFLVKLSEIEENKMGASNLATCFGSNLLRPPEITIESTLAIPKANTCVEFMIRHFEILFCEPMVRVRPRKPTRKRKTFAC